MILMVIQNSPRTTLFLATSFVEMAKLWRSIDAKKDYVMDRATGYHHTSKAVSITDKISSAGPSSSSWFSVKWHNWPRVEVMAGNAWRVLSSKARAIYEFEWWVQDKTTTELYIIYDTVLLGPRCSSGSAGGDSGSGSGGHGSSSSGGGGRSSSSTKSYSSNNSSTSTILRPLAPDKGYTDHFHVLATGLRP